MWINATGQFQHMTTRKLFQVPFAALLYTSVSNCEKINIFVPNALIFWHMRTCSCALKTHFHCLALCRKNPQNPIWRFSPGTWDIQRRVTSPFGLESAPLAQTPRNGAQLKVAEAEITGSRSRGFTTPLGQTRIEKERKREGARALWN